MSDPQRHQMIEQAVRRLPDAQVDYSIFLWQTLATELNSIIGERGFESLYSRSLGLAAVEFAWLEPHAPKPAGESFRLLAACLKGRPAAEAQAASASLLKIFTDTLIILIGELLTNTILLEAWGDEVVNNAGTESRP